MKKFIFLTMGLMFISGVSHATSPFVWRSSTTATADTTKSLCAEGHPYLHGVRVTKADSGTVTIYNSRNAASSALAVIQSTAALVSGGVDFDVLMSSGITYTNSTAGTNLTILYQCQ